MQRTLATSRKLRILVVERGAPSRGGSGWTDADGPVLVMQMKSETPSAFEQRVLERLALAERDLHHFHTATLLTASSEEEDTATTRERIALALARHCGAHDAAELFLEGTVEHELGVSTPLLALADTVRGALGDRAITIQLNLREPSPPRAAEDSAFWRVDARRFRAS
ncbi:MAG: hypothetical protein EOO73_08040 [Myxococcales bacterium]|nr:MAG: hypothetical protein EOO73_08040 [Myxococcales bacterium]